MGFAHSGDTSEQTKREGEQTVAKRLYQQADLNGALVTADALFCDKHQARAVLEAGGDYLFQIKNENRQAFKKARQTAECGPPFLPIPKSPTTATHASTKGK